MQTFRLILLALMTALNLVSVYLGVICMWTFKRRKPYSHADSKTRFAVIIPARNEASVIGNLIKALKRQKYPMDKIDIYVAVNHCTDDTAAVSLASGAKILSCSDAVRCKGDVLHEAVERLLPMDYDAYAIFDADNLPEPDFFQRMNDALAAGEKVCKGRLKAGNALESWVSGGYGLYHAMMEWTYSRPHAMAGFSSNLVGTAFVVHREVFEAMGGWNTSTLCEDTEFAALSTRLGYRVAWVYEALSYDEQVASFLTSLRQRRRWCYGMVQSARLLCRSMFSRSCPKKGMARDFGMLFIISHTAPLAALLMLLSLPFQTPAMLAFCLASLILGYVGMVLAALLLCVLGGYPISKMGATVAMFPIFMVSWTPLQIMALFIPVRQWSPIRHNGQGDTEALEEGAEGTRGNPFFGNRKDSRNPPRKETTRAEG